MGTNFEPSKIEFFADKEGRQPTSFSETKQWVLLRNKLYFFGLSAKDDRKHEIRELYTGILLER
jgi:hypothetical protein